MRRFSGRGGSEKTRNRSGARSGARLGARSDDADVGVGDAVSEARDVPRPNEARERERYRPPAACEEVRPREAREARERER